MRTLGRTGVRVSLVGLGGFHLGLAPPDEAVRIVHAALDHGINFLDNCWDYNGGRSEEIMGAALEGGRRQKAFLMTKLDGRTRAAAAQQLEQSLRRLRTDRIDLVQVHEVIRTTDPERVFGPGGAMEALLDAKRAGKLRYIGFTGHKDPAIHLQMLHAAEAHGAPFDAVQMPLNVMDPHFKSFENKVVPYLLERNIGILGMKPLGAGVILRTGLVSAPECLRYAMSLPTSVVITGCQKMADLEQALDVAFDFRPLSADEKRALLERTAGAGDAGRYELFKTTDQFDGTSHHPNWLEAAQL
jgi:aryl-alcohol dehydrogenase-like predicted oxidoreductase